MKKEQPKKQQPRRAAKPKGPTESERLANLEARVDTLERRLPVTDRRDRSRRW